MSIPAAVMSAVLPRVRRRIIIVMGTSRSEKRTAETKQGQQHHNETGLETIQICHTGDGFSLLSPTRFAF